MGSRTATKWTWRRQHARIAKIIGENLDDGNFAQWLQRFFAYLQANLVLPCEVTGIEDFRWEAAYVIGRGDPDEYAELKVTCPSYHDTYELFKIAKGDRSEWMMMHGDIQAHVRRKSDGKEFVLGLSELKTVAKRSANHQLLDDFTVFFGNYR